MASIVKQIAKNVKKEGGRIFLVGGTVRDKLLGLKPDNIDLEVYGLSITRLKKVLSKYGQVKEVGKTFGVLKLIYRSRTSIIEVDVSLPRRENKIGKGHRGFRVEASLELNSEQATRRRDFTVNAIMQDALTGEIIDPFNGRVDLKNKTLRAVNSKTFTEDPLRGLRAMQFAGRFEFSIEPKTARLIKKMLPQVEELSYERIWEEWKKLLLNSKKPSAGLEAAMQIGIIETLYPEFVVLKKTPQNKRWHPEGSVWNHTKLTTDKAAESTRKEELKGDEALVIMLAALTHDLGKSVTSKKRRGVVVSLGHAKTGEKLAAKFLDKIGAPQKVKKQVRGLVLNHMKLMNWVNSSLPITNGLVRKLSRALAQYDINIYQLHHLRLADWGGRGVPMPRTDKKVVYANKFAAKAKKLNLYKGQPEPIIKGRGLIELGFKPSADFGRVLELSERLAESNFSQEQILDVIGKRSQKNSIKNVIVKMRKIFNS